MGAASNNDRSERAGWAVGVAMLLGSLGAGCGSEDAGSGRTAASAAMAAIIEIAVDSDRDGTVELDSESERAHRHEWSAGWGASFLCNLDDDDGDGVPDAWSPEVDVTADDQADALDLARIRLAPWPAAPPGAVGTLSLDAAAVGHVRIHRLQADGSWSSLLGLQGPCGTGSAEGCVETPSAALERADLVAGVELGIEGLDFVGLERAAGWDGMVELSWEIHDVQGKAFVRADDASESVDRALLREAPWLMRGNLDPADGIYASEGSDTFTAALGPVLEAAGLPLHGIPWIGPDGWGDQWTQDVFQLGYSSIPAPGGTVQGMRVALPRPYSYGTLPADWLMQHYLGPDRTVVVVYREPDTGNTYDSYGNHELVPPYTNGDAYPLGRIVVGMPDEVLDETVAFYQAQSVQEPILGLDTSWLAVGHVDEVLSFVPAAGKRGWKLLAASPSAFTALLQGWQQQGHGAEQMFVGKQSYNGIDAAVSIDQVLGDPDMASWNQAAQTHIDQMVDDMTMAVGLGPDEIVEVPVYFTQDSGLVAFVPSDINSLVVGDRFVAADPFGPAIDGEDGLKRDLLQRLATAANGLGPTGQGLQVAFVDDWEWYHLLMGEVHCATNPDGPPAQRAWWEVGR
jgi:protein-arginine deiminase